MLWQIPECYVTPSTIPKQHNSLNSQLVQHCDQVQTKILRKYFEQDSLSEKANFSRQYLDWRKWFVQLVSLGWLSWQSNVDEETASLHLVHVLVISELLQTCEWWANIVKCHDDVDWVSQPLKITLMTEYHHHHHHHHLINDYLNININCTTTLQNNNMFTRTSFIQPSIYKSQLKTFRSWNFEGKCQTYMNEWFPGDVWWVW